jgi:hypothetical protein
MRRFALVLVASGLLAGCATDVEDRAGLGGPVSGPSHPTTHIAYRGGQDAGVVTAESRYGSATVSGPTRSNARGRREVRLPGGTWVECAYSCSDTLRRETVDFWQGRDTRVGPADGPGYFQWRR